MSPSKALGGAGKAFDLFSSGRSVHFRSEWLGSEAMLLKRACPPCPHCGSITIQEVRAGRAGTIASSKPTQSSSGNSTQVDDRSASVMTQTQRALPGSSW